MTGKPREKLNKPRARKEAAKVLAVALQIRYRHLLEATGEDEIVVATGDLAQCMYENIEFVIWALKSLGGLNPPPSKEFYRITTTRQPVRPLFEKPPEPVLDPAPLDLPCNCEPFKDALTPSMRHASSCPKWEPSY